MLTAARSLDLAFDNVDKKLVPAKAVADSDRISSRQSSQQMMKYQQCKSPFRVQSTAKRAAMHIELVRGVEHQTKISRSDGPVLPPSLKGDSPCSEGIAYRMRGVAARSQGQGEPITFWKGSAQNL